MILPSYYNKNNIDKLYSIDYNRILNESLKNKKSSNSSNNCLFIVAPQIGLLNDYNKNVFANITELIYKNYNDIEDIFILSLCSVFIQIFNQTFWISKNGVYPSIGSTIYLKDVREEKWIINPTVVKNLYFNDMNSCRNFVIDYLNSAENSGNKLVIKPFRTLISSIDSAIIPLVEESVFYYSCIKGRQPIYENELFSPLGEYKSFFSPIGKNAVYGSLILKSKYSILGLLKNYEKIFFVGEKKERIIYSICDVMENYSLHNEIFKKFFILNDLTIFSENYNVNEINSILKDKKINIINSKDVFKEGYKN